MPAGTSATAAAHSTARLKRELSSDAHTVQAGSGALFDFPSNGLRTRFGGRAATARLRRSRPRSRGGHGPIASGFSRHPARPRPQYACAQAALREGAPHIGEQRWLWRGLVRRRAPPRHEPRRARPLERTSSTDRVSRFGVAPRRDDRASARWHARLPAPPPTSGRAVVARPSTGARRGSRPQVARRGVSSGARSRGHSARRAVPLERAGPGPRPHAHPVLEGVVRLEAAEVGRQAAPRPSKPLALSTSAPGAARARREGLEACASCLSAGHSMRVD